jgi:hypothetical protein
MRAQATIVGIERVVPRAASGLYEHPGAMMMLDTSR